MSLATITCTIPVMRLPLFLTAHRPALDEPGPTPLWEADLDDIEVLWNDRVGKGPARLAQDLRTEIPVGKVREGEQSNAGRSRELGGARGRRVQRLVRAPAL